MKYCPLTETVPDTEALASEYTAAREIGPVRLGELTLYIRVKRSVYYIPYRDVRRIFRRVQLVHARMCCGNGGLEVENLVVCGDAGELIQVQLPGTRAAKALMEELQTRIPEAEFGAPKKTPDAE